MDTRTSEAKPSTPAVAGNSGLEDRFGLHQRYPTIAYLRAAARRRPPSFAFEYMDGGAGEDGGIARNWAALAAVELVPRYGVMTELPPIDIELFGHRYAAPLGVAPMGGPAFVWPGADEYLARAAQAANIPYVLATPGGMTIERACELAPDVCWFQLYRFPRDDHAVGKDMVRRAAAAGARALVITLDTPVRTTRPREVVAGIRSPFRPDLRMAIDVMLHPGWLLAMTRHGIPRFAMLRAYAGDSASLDQVMRFVRQEMRGAFSWEEVARYRDIWKGPLVLKGIIHPEDAERAVEVGADAVVVSNHGGRQVEALPAAIDALPGVAERVGHRAAVMMDSGIRSGTDIVRALALGARAVLVGKAFLWGLGALGERGPAHVIEILMGETQATLGQLGVATPAAATDVEVRHSGALHV
jgi:(S)-mandelate dehydrogenase